MKLIYLANVRIPTEKAHGLQTMKMCETFARAGLAVQLLVPYRFNHLKEEAFEYYSIEKNFKITKLPCLDLQPLGFIFGKMAFFAQLISFLAVARVYLFFQKYDVLYTRDQYSGLFFKDFIAEIHFLPKKIGCIHRGFWKRAGRLIVLTSLTGKCLVEQGVKQYKILIAPDGVDVEMFSLGITKEQARQKVDLPSDKRIILYSGSFFLYGWKGVDVLLEAAKLFDTKEYLFVLVGGSIQELARIEKKYQLTNLKLIDHRPHRDIPFFLAAADVLVLPNKKGDAISEGYTSPLKLFEYMASRRPIIASDLPAIREVLNERNSILVEPNNPAKLAEGIKNLFTDPVLATSICESAFSDVINYSWSKRAQKILNFIRTKDVQKDNP